MKYLKQDYSNEALKLVYSKKEPEPLQHTIWESDHMFIKHNIPCAVCFDNHAMVIRNYNVGQFEQSVQPCKKCQEDGWNLSKRKNLFQIIKDFFTNAD